MLGGMVKLIMVMTENSMSSLHDDGSTGTLEVMNLT